MSKPGDLYLPGCSATVKFRLPGRNDVFWFCSFMGHDVVVICHLFCHNLKWFCIVEYSVRIIVSPLLIILYIGLRSPPPNAGQVFKKRSRISIMAISIQAIINSALIILCAAINFFMNPPVRTGAFPSIVTPLFPSYTPSPACRSHIFYSFLSFLSDSDSIRISPSRRSISSAPDITSPSS